MGSSVQRICNIISWLDHWQHQSYQEKHQISGWCCLLWTTQDKLIQYGRKISVLSTPHSQQKCIFWRNCNIGLTCKGYSTCLQRIKKYRTIEVEQSDQNNPSLQIVEVLMLNFDILSMQMRNIEYVSSISLQVLVAPLDRIWFETTVGLELSINTYSPEGKRITKYITYDSEKPLAEWFSPFHLLWIKPFLMHIHKIFSHFRKNKCDIGHDIASSTYKGIRHLSSHSTRKM